MDEAIRKWYPGAVRPTRVETVQDAMRLRLSHLHVPHLDRRVALDTGRVTHVRWGPEAATRWTTLSRYARAYAARVNIIELAEPGALRLHRSALPELAVHRVRLDGGDEAAPTYAPTPSAGPPRSPTAKGGGAFVLRSFDYESSAATAAHVAGELGRLWRTRDDQPAVHFHLEGNGGGGLTAVYLMVRCLAGPRRPWMVGESVVETSPTGRRARRRWDPWAPERDPNQRRILRLLRFSPEACKDYATPYAGPITLHVDPRCGSSTWYFITLLVYAFGGAIERWTEERWGVPVKAGRATGGTLRIVGSSATSTGDGNAVDVRVGGMTVSVPTQASAQSPIQRRDFGRFWLPSSS